jgi:hypothetical protein
MKEREDVEVSLTPEQLRALPHGVAATLMPVHDGWRVQYCSLPSFEDEPGSTFPSFEAAIAALSEMLPRVNSEDQRRRARAHTERLEAPEDSGVESE